MVLVQVDSAFVLLKFIERVFFFQHTIFILCRHTGSKYVSSFKKMVFFDEYLSIISTSLLFVSALSTFSF